MKRILLLVICQFGLLSGGRAFADIVTLKDGGEISGLVESGNTQELHVKVGDRSETIDIHQVQAIQFGGASAAPAAAPAKAAATAPAAADSDAAQPNSLVLKDGTRVTGRWWSIDAANVHFLVNNQLQQYPRANVSVVAFENAARSPQPPQPTRSTPPPATPVQPPASAAKPAQPSEVARSSAEPPQQPATAKPPTPQPAAPKPAAPAQPAGSTPRSTSSRGPSQPDDIGVVYSWNGKALTPLERGRAVAHGSGSNQYWEIAGPQSRVRVNEDSTLVFVVYLPQGVDPASYSLFPLDTVEGSRRTRSDKSHRGGIMTWPVDIGKNNDASIITYVLTVRDLPPGEYSFSPSSSNDAYCVGVDPAAPGQ